MNWAALAKWTGMSAATIWLALAVAVGFGGLFLRSEAIVINLTMASVFAAVAVVLYWRVKATGSVNAISNGHPAMRLLMRLESLTSTCMFLVGLALFAAAAFRLVVEGMPVFG